jgi:hypothetical protein
VKATSFASEIASQLVPPGERALFIYAMPRNYVATILAGENSLKELHALSEFRRQRLGSRGIELSPPSNEGEHAAAAWACEMTSLESAAAAMEDRTIGWLDFDAMLSDMPSELKRIADAFGFAATEDRLAKLATGPLTSRYSKDLSYEYSPALRHQLIEQEMRLRGPEIDAGLAMLRAASEKSPLLARALSRAEGS